MPPHEVLAVFQDFENHPLAPFEAHYDSREFAAHWWRGSRLAAFVHSQLNRAQEPDDGYGANTERGQLALALVDAFAAEAQDAYAEFFVLHLTYFDRLREHISGKPSPFAYVLERLDDNYRFLNVLNWLPAKYTDLQYWPGHPGAEINQIVGRQTASAIAACLDSGSCGLARFPDTSVLRLASPPR